VIMVIWFTGGFTSHGNIRVVSGVTLFTFEADLFHTEVWDFRLEFHAHHAAFLVSSTRGSLLRHLVTSTFLTKDESWFTDHTDFLMHNLSVHVKFHLATDRASSHVVGLSTIDWVDEVINRGNRATWLTWLLFWLTVSGHMIKFETWFAMSTRDLMTNGEAFLTFWVSSWESRSIKSTSNSSSSSRHTSSSGHRHSTNLVLFSTIIVHVMSDTSMSSVFPHFSLITSSTVETFHWEWITVKVVSHTAHIASFKHWVTHWAWHKLSADAVVFGVHAHWHITLH